MPLHPWIFLSAAIAAEVTGITVMKVASDTGSLPALLFMYAMVGLSFYLFAMAVRHLPLALAYATWETLGLISITVIGFRYFGESLTPQKVLGIAIVVAGVVMINLGSATHVPVDSGSKSQEGR